MSANMTTQSTTGWNYPMYAKYDRRQRFDRLSFDPSDSYTQEIILRALRQHGHRRRLLYSKCKGADFHTDRHALCCASSSFEALHLTPDGCGVYLDLGCGDSADAAIARDCGYLAFGLDLFPPSAADVNSEDVTNFMLADVVERIPFPSDFADAASSHAVIDLIEPEARGRFYAEVYRVLKPGGLFSLGGIKLVNGYGFNAAKEKAACRAVGFRRAGAVYGIEGGVFRKPVSVRLKT